MKRKNLFMMLLFGASISIFTACEDGETDDSTLPTAGERVYHITAKFDDSDTDVYMAAVSDLDSGSLTFVNNGYALSPVRSARVFVDDLGWVYVFNYGGGYLTKYSYANGSYSELRSLDISLSMGGVAHVRPWKINEETILIHNILTEDVEMTSTEEADADYVAKGIAKRAVMYVTNVKIPELSIAEIMDTWTIPISEWDAQEQAYVFRIDAPTVLDDKIYYGVGRRALGEIETTGMHTIVLDYPSLENPKYIRTTLGNGNTNGYRGGNMHAIDGYVYQASASDPATIVRLKDGEYDSSWVFNVSETLGEAFATNNWYHAEEGICYLSANFTNAEDENNTWGVVRVDIHNKTAVRMNVPMSKLHGYQHGVVNDGKFYMAISPVGATGESAPFIYAFDIHNVSPDAFTKGLELDKGNIFVEGIF
ncbi:MAG: hypothetical protein ACK5LR_03355 [Mangrovibacterium sp.]